MFGEERERWRQKGGVVGAWGGEVEGEERVVNCGFLFFGFGGRGDGLVES